MVIEVKPTRVQSQSDTKVVGFKVMHGKILFAFLTLNLEKTKKKTTSYPGFFPV